MWTGGFRQSPETAHFRPEASDWSKNHWRSAMLAGLTEKGILKAHFGVCIKRAHFMCRLHVLVPNVDRRVSEGFRNRSFSSIFVGRLQRNARFCIFLLGSLRRDTHLCSVLDIFQWLEKRLLKAHFGLCIKRAHFMCRLHVLVPNVDRRVSPESRSRSFPSRGF